ncbi:MAG: hypothetical protein A3C61_02180 [Candidatus Yanofskybacteria bacterium RIFCSPHIGHO2_02_FULL_39_10]|uniref:Metallo-beta-lactamase domain-containing protein n=1 Tax=Candidatus Yanofskybacteria bacterium RIFCSPHIGHO2_02_FULL_39_10 TaxID=1802674 RepID=A0A1F8F7B9_9BACT|nr:MAG: hypothetical protein A3C61_02180 [Candidatus Yanofskybacteria bacterium RIFCSPHIGHO2_02_FULL_39_10]
MQNRRLSLIHLVIILCLSVFALSTNSIASQKDGLLKVYFLDIGQGDVIFIESPSGQQVLIDGGPDNKILSKLGEVMSFYDKDIDLVVMTHPDADHASGLVDVLDRYEIKNIVFSDIINDKALYQSWKGAVSQEGADVIDPVAGKVIDLGDGVTLVIISPLESIVGKTVKEGETNNNSVVVMLKYKDLEVLLTGDLETKGERAIMLDGINIDVDVLKVAHHGSKTSTSEEFISATTPEVAIIQVGAKNRYGHPTQEVLNRLENFGIKYYRNDVDGDIELVSDGINYQINAHP